MKSEIEGKWRGLKNVWYVKKKFCFWGDFEKKKYMFDTRGFRFKYSKKKVPPREVWRDIFFVKK